MATLLSNVRHSTEIDRAVSVLPMALFQSGPATRDLRGFLKLLEERGQLKRVTAASAQYSKFFSPLTTDGDLVCNTACLQQVVIEQ